MVRVIVFLGSLTAIAAISTDIYLPAIPNLEQSWNEPLTRINLALSGFFVAFCSSILFFGPLSDRFGRKRPLLAGLTLYCMASMLCATADNVEQLVLYRILQGFGAGSASAISLAITKDRFTDDKERGRVLSYIAIIMTVAPMLAPTLGAAILRVSEWQTIFFFQAAFGLMLLISVAAMHDSLLIRETINAKQIVWRYLSFFSNRIFFSYCLISSLLMAPMFAYIAASSTIYQETMNLGALEYGFLFAFNALSLMLGSLTYLKLQKKYTDKNLIVLAISIAMVGAVLQFSLSSLNSVLSFALPMFLITFGVGLGRAPSVNSALASVTEHVGIASSVVVFSNFFVASIAMLAASINFDNRVAAIAVIALFSCTTNAVIMFKLRRFQST